VHGQRSPPRCSPPVAGPLGAALWGHPDTVRWWRALRTAAAGPDPLLQANAFVSILDRFAMPRCSSRSLPTSTSAVRDRAERPARTSGLRVGQPAWGLVSDSLGLVRTMRLPWWSRPRRRGRRVRLDPLALGMARAVGGAFSVRLPGGIIYVGDTPCRRSAVSGAHPLMSEWPSAPPWPPRGPGRGAAVHVGGRSSWSRLAALALSLALRLLDEPPRTGPPQPMAPFLAVARSRTALFVLGLAFVEGGVLLGVLTLLPSAIEAAAPRPPSPEASRPSTASPSSSSRPGWAGCPGACTRRG
jgi:hypothetical protein